MIVKCPTCCREYNVDSGKYVSEYTFRCPNCKSEILIRNSDGITKETGMSEPQQIIVYRDNKSKKDAVVAVALRNLQSWLQY